MIQESCTCNFGIPGVDKLPTHDHNEARMWENIRGLNSAPGWKKQMSDQFPLQDSVRIWVDWKKVAREWCVG